MVRFNIQGEDNDIQKIVVFFFKLAIRKSTPTAPPSIFFCLKDSPKEWAPSDGTMDVGGGGCAQAHVTFPGDIPLVRHRLGAIIPDGEGADLFIPAQGAPNGSQVPPQPGGLFHGTRVWGPQPAKCWEKKLGNRKAMPGSYVVPLFLKNHIYIFFRDTFQGKLHLGLLVTWSFACKRFEN